MCICWGLADEWPKSGGVRRMPPPVTVRVYYRETLRKLLALAHSTKLSLQSGAATEIFLSHDDIHQRTFYWLWVPLIQQGLDNFREYWNNYRLKNSKGKLNASGSSPLNMLINPTSVVATACNCSINVNPQTVYRLREAYGGQAAREEAF
ncbi:hypothetical protein B0H19DRAFT_1077226 [Mycena capillaripes]|nr:hypothetical protein B0H19DRAFT_1077226 [Mycena capillaripes]